MKSIVRFGLVLPALLLAGCIQSHRTPGIVYYTPTTTPPPVSDRPVVRVYPSPAAPEDAVSRNVDLAHSVSRLLKDDPLLASASQNVEATVDNGVVTLRGTVPSEHERDEMVGRIAALPGVARVDDRLGLEPQ